VSADRRDRTHVRSSAFPKLADGLRIYAIGDIHGRFDLLWALYARIAAEMTGSPPRRSVEIFLGDYIDRGPQSADVVEWLVSETPAADERICLRGNHEDMLLSVLDGAAAMPHWLSNGGSETLLSYDVVPPLEFRERAMLEARASFLSIFPRSHRNFMLSLSQLAEFGSYLFVHAGIRPGVPLEDQDPHDLVWIREPFLTSDADFGRIVVHGHTPAREPEIRRNRINIDTGAVFSGRLTCIVLEEGTRRFLQVDAMSLHRLG
jgi:serine/threonine protein phosphatase 1